MFIFISKKKDVSKNVSTMLFLTIRMDKVKSHHKNLCIVVSFFIIFLIFQDFQKQPVLFQ